MFSGEYHSIHLMKQQKSYKLDLGFNGKNTFLGKIQHWNMYLILIESNQKFRQRQRSSKYTVAS